MPRRRRGLAVAVVATPLAALVSACAGSPAGWTGPAVTPGPVDLGPVAGSSVPGLGTTWEEAAWDPADTISAMTALDDSFVALGQSDGRHAVWTSTDGRTWVPSPQAPDLGEKGSEVLAAGGDRVVALGTVVGESALMVHWWSDDGGRSWQQGDPKPADELGRVEDPCGEGDGPQAGGVWRAAAGPAGFVAVGREIVGLDPIRNILSGGCGWAMRTVLWHSPDGLTWDRVPVPDEFAALWVSATAGNDERSVLTTLGRPKARAWSSSDGLAWEEALIEDAPFQLTNVAPLGSGFVALGADDSASQQATWLSQDGRAWSPGRPLPGDGLQVNEMVSGGPGLVAVGWLGLETDRFDDDRAVTFTSADGLDWSVSDHIIEPPTSDPPRESMSYGIGPLAATDEHAVFLAPRQTSDEGDPETWSIWVSPGGAGDGS